MSDFASTGRNRSRDQICRKAKQRTTKRPEGEQERRLVFDRVNPALSVTGSDAHPDFEFTVRRKNRVDDKRTRRPMNGCGFHTEAQVPIR